MTSTAHSTIKSQIVAIMIANQTAPQTCVVAAIANANIVDRRSGTPLGISGANYWYKRFVTRGIAPGAIDNKLTANVARSLVAAASFVEIEAEVPVETVEVAAPAKVKAIRGPNGRFLPRAA